MKSKKTLIIIGIIVAIIIVVGIVLATKPATEEDNQEKEENTTSTANTTNTANTTTSDNTIEKDKDNNQTVNLKNSAEELLNIDLKDYVVSEDGEDNGDYAFLAFELKEGSEEKVDEILQEACGDKVDTEGYEIPGYMGHRLAEKAKSEELETVHVKFKTVNTDDGAQTTRSIEIYTTTDTNGTTWLYIFG